MCVCVAVSMVDPPPPPPTTDERMRAPLHPIHTIHTPLTHASTRNTEKKDAANRAKLYLAGEDASDHRVRALACLLACFSGVCVCVCVCVCGEQQKGVDGDG
jgi:hypothetical protein